MGQKTIYICDRCGNEMDPPRTIVLTPIGKRNETVYLDSSIVLSGACNDIYLCEGCAKAFWKFMRKENENG